jgi:hypothetical protein
LDTAKPYPAEGTRSVALPTAKPYPAEGTRSVALPTAKPYPAEGTRSVALPTAKPYPAEGTRSVALPTAKRELIIQKAGVRITLSCECGEAVDGAYLEFESETIERIVCFLGLLHHEYVKLHIHKDLIFRIVAGSADLRSVIQSKTVITFYCGHCV